MRRGQNRRPATGLRPWRYQCVRVRDPLSRKAEPVSGTRNGPRALSLGKSCFSRTGAQHQHRQIRRLHRRMSMCIARQDLQDHGLNREQAAVVATTPKASNVSVHEFQRRYVEHDGKSAPPQNKFQTPRTRDGACCTCVARRRRKIARSVCPARQENEQSKCLWSAYG